MPKKKTIRKKAGKKKLNKAGVNRIKYLVSQKRASIRSLQRKPAFYQTIGDAMEEEKLKEQIERLLRKI